MIPCAASSDFGPALEWALTARDIDVQEAYRVGFVTRIFPEGTVVKEVTDIALKMAEFDRSTLIETKRMSKTFCTTALMLQ